MQEMPETWVQSWVGKIPWRRTWPPIPVFLPGESHGQRSQAGQSLEFQTVRHDWVTESTHTHTLLSKIIVAVAFCCSEELNMTLLPCVPLHMLGAGTVERDAHFLHLHTWNTFMNHFIFLLAFYLNTEYSTLHSILIILLLANSQIFSAE